MTKLAGMVASFAPAVAGSAKAFLLSSALLVGVLAGAFLGLTVNEARAACTQSPPGTWTCTGATTNAPSASRSGMMIVNLANDFSLDSSAGGLSFTQSGGAGGVAITQAAGGGTISAGNGNGIFASLTASARGSVSINVNGAVSGLGSANQYGIGAFVGSSGESATVTAATVTGAKTGIKVVNSGSGTVSISASGAVTGTSDYGIYAKTGTSSAGALSVTAAAVTGGKAGIRAIASGTGAVSVKATGAVTGASVAGVKVNSYASATDMAIDVMAVRGSAGIDARHAGSGKLDIKATSSVTGTSAEGIFGFVSDSSGGSLTITAAAVKGKTVGIYAKSAGAGDISISTSGSVSATAVARNTFGIYAKSAGTGDISISASGSVSTIGAHGINVKHTGSGDVAIEVSRRVLGGLDRAASAIVTSVSSGNIVTIQLNSGASVRTGWRNAIIDTAGNASVTVNTGASIRGKVNLGAGNDTLTFAGGTFSRVTEMQGGAGTDKLTFVSGSGALHQTVQSAGLRGWESVFVESGAAISGSLRLAADSGNLTFNGAPLDSSVTLDGGSGGSNTLHLNGVSGSVNGANVAGWETISVGASSTIGFGSETLATDLLRVIGTLDLGDDSDTDDELTVSGNFSGGGTVTLDANFSSASSGSDSLAITGNVTGTTTVNLSRLDSGDVTTANNAARIDAVVTVTGTVDEGAFRLGTTGIGQNSAFVYELQFDAANKRFDLVLISKNACKAVSGTSGAFACSGSSPINPPQSLSASGATALLVTLHSETPVDTRGAAFTLTQTGGAGGITLTQSGGGERIKGAQSGIVASNSSGGAISINVNGTVTGVAENGIHATNDGNGSGITITAAAVSGADSGIEAEEGGSGAVTIAATGTVSATATSGIGIDVSASGGNVTVSAATVTGTDTGIKVAATGAGRVSVSASGAVSGTGSDGIFVEHSGTGAASISVSGSVRGGAGAGSAAIRTAVSNDRAVTISLSSGASVGTTAGTPNAIVDSGGNATVTVNTGAAIAGKVNLGAGTDRLIFAGGSFSGVEEMDGGAGTDTLEFGNVSGSVSGTVTNWEMVIIQSGAAIGFGTGTHSLNAGTLTVATGGTLDVGDDADTRDELTVSGNFAGGGTVTFDANFASGNAADSDTLAITGNATGTITVDVSRIGSGVITDGNSAARIEEVISVTGTVAAGAFSVGSVSGLQNSIYTYRLEFQQDRTFDLVRGFVNECTGTGASGAFTCSGANQVGAPQSLSASGATALSVMLNAETPVDADGSAFTLTQTGGTGGISFTQSANGLPVTARADGIVATNSGGGAISIAVNGSLTASGGDAIRTVNDASGSGIAITAASVSGADSGIRAVEGGSGAVRIVATGTVTGVSEDGIYAKTGSGGAVMVTAATVTGGDAGIRALAGGAGAVSVRASGAVLATESSGIGIEASASGGGVAISAATVAGAATGIKVAANGTGSVSVSASGAVTGTGGDGIFVDHVGTGATTIAVSGAVTGGTGTGNAAIRTDVPSGSGVTVMLGRGASVGKGASNAIMGGAGDSEVTVAAGAAIAGKVSLGSGTDTLAFSGGDFSAVTEMDGGDGPGDLLRFSGGSGGLNDAIVGSSGEGLKGWEGVVIQSGAAISGAVKLAGDSGNLAFDGAAIGGVTALDGGGGSANTLAFNSVSGTLAASALTGWEDVVIGAESQVQLTGSRLPLTATARLSVTGTLAFGTTTSTTDTFTVQGDFAGGGVVAIDANFSAPENGSPTADRLVIQGSVTGTTVIVINDRTPDDGAVPGEDIEVVMVDDDAEASAFTLANTVAHGAYVYDLAHVPDETGDGAKFVLRPGSETSDAGAVLRLAPAAIAGAFGRSVSVAARTAARMPVGAGSGIGAPMTLTERLEKQLGQDAAGMGADGGPRSVWARFHSDSQSSDAADGFGESDVKSAGVLIGADLLSGETAEGTWIAGLTAQYGSVSAEANGVGGVGKQEATGYGLGAAATWFGANGLYADAAAQSGSYEADYSADSTGVIKNGVGGRAASAAVEVGRRFATNESMTLVPRGRLGWSSVSSDKFASEDGVEIDLGTSSVTEASVGVAAEFGMSKGAVRVSGTLSRRLGDPDGVSVGGQTVEQAGRDGWMELGFGGTFDIDENSAVFVDGAYRAGNDSTGLSLSGGLKLNW